MREIGFTLLLLVSVPLIHCVFILPAQFTWIVHLQELHPRFNPPKLSTAEGQYYFDYTQGPYVATRQQNEVWPETWREDIPYNVFLGVGGLIYMGYLNGTSGKTTCIPPYLKYSPSYWPRNFLASNCTLVGQSVTLPKVFGGQYQDGKLGNAYKCKMEGFDATAYTSVDESGLLRMDFEERLPGWNAQTWDTVLMTPQSFPPNYWQPPSWLQCTP